MKVSLNYLPFQDKEIKTHINIGSPSVRKSQEWLMLLLEIDSPYQLDESDFNRNTYWLPER